MTAYRIEAVCYAVLLSVTGLAVAASIVIRTISEAIDAATTYPRVPDTIPAAWSVET
jgi:hypothetical protein